MSSFNQIWNTLDIPDSEYSTDELREVLAERIWTAIDEEEDVIIKSPTAAGKSYLVSSLFEGAVEEDRFSTDDLKQVLHLSQTKDARKEGESVSGDHGLESVSLKGRQDTCPVAAGDYDDEIEAPKGMKPSEWFDEVCDFSGVRFSEAHEELNEFVGGLPCCDSSSCESMSQYADMDEGDIIHATHNFAYVEDLIEDKTVIFDERPSFSEYYKDKERHPFEQAITEYLNDNIDFKYKWADLMSDFRRGNQEELRRVKEAVEENLEDDEEESHWNKSDEYSYVLAPEVILAIISAEKIIPSGKSHKSRYLGEHDGLKVVFDGDDNIRGIHNPPDLSSAKNVVCLDARPSPSLWKLNLGKTEEMEVVETVESSEQKEWRVSERNLYVVQIEESTRPYTTRWGSGSSEKTAGEIIARLRERYGEDFRSCISPASIENDIRKFMQDTGIPEEEVITLHYGEQKSSNEFKGERSGLLVGCIDPGDGSILDKLSFLEKEATPNEETEREDKDRKSGRGFVGSNSETAEEILKSVREENVAQSIGRFAREPDDPDSKAIVYVWTDAIPDDLVDEKIDTPTNTESKEYEAQQVLLESDIPLTKKEVMEKMESECSKKHVWDSLEKLVNRGRATVSEGTGKHGANEYERSNTVEKGVELKR